MNYVSSSSLRWDYLLETSKLSAKYLSVVVENLDVKYDEAEVDTYVNSDDGKNKIKLWYNSHQTDFKARPK